MSERVGDFVERGLRIARRMAIAFGLSTALAIGVGAAVTDNAFAQIVVTVLAAVGFWIPMLALTIGVGRMLDQRRERKVQRVPANLKNVTPAGARSSWDRLAAAAPAERERVRVLQRSLEQSHVSLRGAALDPDAHDLCVLIDRRLPELIDRELDSLPPDDAGRRRQIAQLVTMVEQFARHCSRKRDGDPAVSGVQAEILRRRFEDRLNDRGPFDQ